MVEDLPSGAGRKSPQKLWTGLFLAVTMESKRRSEGRGTSRRSSNTPLARVKMMVLAPMPSASETMAMAVNPGLRRNMRAAKRRSARNSSKRRRPREVRMFSLCVSTVPNSMRARRRASAAREAGAFEVGGAKLDVGAELGFDVGLDRGAVRERARVGAEFREQFHGL